METHIELIEDIELNLSDIITMRNMIEREILDISNSLSIVYNRDFVDNIQRINQKLEVMESKLKQIN